MNMHHPLKRTLWLKMKSWNGVWFHLAGLIAILWFLVRVVPNPKRAQYPCQQVALSISLGYIAFWGFLFTGVVVWMRHAKTQVGKTTPALAAVFIVLFTISGAVFATGHMNNNTVTGASWDPAPKEPMGVPTGVNPGRVVWVWNPNATESDLTGYWWQQENNNQAVIDAMVSTGIQRLAGIDDEAAAWDAIFSYFNTQHGAGAVGYQPGESIAIKLNFNNALGGFGDPYTQEDNDRDASPYVVKALLRQLVNVVGVAQDDITLFDASRPIANWFYNRVVYETYPAEDLVEEFASVHFADSTGGAVGREQVIASSVKMYFSDGVVRTLPTCVVDAQYIIDVPLLKRHPINNGVTLSGKNFFGSFIEPVSDLHPYHQSGLIMGNAAPQVDLFAFNELGGKTLLFLGDGMFATKVDHKTIAKFLMYPFNGDWANSLFFAQDPVAIDSVMYDFLLTEGTNPIEGSQNYLHQAAVPQPNVYDPEDDGTYLSTSLGVHEHWDRTVEIFSQARYSGLAGNGIDYQAIGAEYAAPDVVITSPLESHVYLFGNDFGGFPLTFILGKINVSAQMNGEYVSVEKVEFYLDDTLRTTDTEAPYCWLWRSFSFGRRHTIKVVASYMYYNTTQTTSSELPVWKLF